MKKREKKAMSELYKSYLSKNAKTRVKVKSRKKTVGIALPPKIDEKSQKKQPTFQASQNKLVAF